MYAVVRAGGKQYKVAEGDVIDIEHVEPGNSKLELTPVLVVDDQGKAHADQASLAKTKVSAEVVGETKGPKVKIFKYRSKSRYRKKGGHRQNYSSVKISSIKLQKRSTTKKSEGKES
ncbi:MAG: 50S ribosomal protein L21 [Actinomycetota bacterium]|nr:50S ribosomal protein L21 [Actinomycetota bacterium]